MLHLCPRLQLDALRQAKQERKGDGIALKAYVTFARHVANERSAGSVWRAHR